MERSRPRRFEPSPYFSDDGLVHFPTTAKAQRRSWPARRTASGRLGHEAVSFENIMADADRARRLHSVPGCNLIYKQQSRRESGGHSDGLALPARVEGLSMTVAANRAVRHR